MLLALAFASGMCGLAYEVLYSRLLTTYLGDMVTVSAAILASFLTGIGLGSLYARRWHRWLWLIEALIGVYGIGIGLGFSALSPADVGAWLPRVTGGPVPLIATVVSLVAVPSVLIGCSVPLFASYLAEAAGARADAQPPEADSFARVYTLYNLGAGACVLLIEFWLLRSLGLTWSVVAIATVNFAVAAGLKRAVDDAELAPLPPPSATSKAPLAILLAVSAASAVYQLLILRFVGTVFGPFHENFALVLWLAMTGLATGALLVRRRQVGLSSWLVGGGLVLLGSALVLGDAARIWAALSGALVTQGLGRTLAKAGVLLVMALPAFTVFGGTVPAYLRTVPEDRAEAGRALAVSSFGNCAGYLLAVTVLLQRSSYLGLVLLVALIVCGGGLWLSRAHPRRASAAILASGIVAAVVIARWPEEHFALGHLSFVSSEKLAQAEASYVSSERIKRLDGDVSIVRLDSGAEYVTINGYSSFAVAEDGATNHREVIVGIAPALYVPSRERALVLGTGTGITAGATATLFDHTTVVEINPAVFDALPRFSEHNFGLHARQDVSLRLDDGLSVLANSSERYDLVISTVTSPVYFSSSKLYTVDFFELVKSRLSDGGVFAFWFDARLSEAGTGIILETMARVFDDCHFVFLFDTYYEAICGAGPLAPKPLGQAWPAPLTEAMARVTGEVGLDGLLDAILFRPTRFSGQRWADEANTFDLPILEQLMARETLAGEQPWDFDAWVKLDLEGSLAMGEPYVGPRFSLRCHLLARVGARSMLPACFERLTPKGGGDWDRDFVDLAYDYLLSSKRSVIDFENLVRALLLHDQRERALTVLDRRKKGRTPTLEVIRLELKLALDREVTDEEVAELYARAPLGSEVRRFLIRLALRRKQPAAALAHLAFLSRIYELTDREKALMAQLSGAGP